MAIEKRLIDQNKVYQFAYAGCIRHGESPGECYHDEPCERLIFAFTVAEPVDAVEVVHGRWVHCQGKSNLWYCSECGEKIFYNPIRRTYNIEKRPVHEVNKYCRGCGAKMDLETLR